MKKRKLNTDKASVERRKEYKKLSSGEKKALALQQAKRRAHQTPAEKRQIAKNAELRRKRLG